MTKWPNWIDLIIVTIILRTSYNGFGRGLFAELLNVVGVVSVTALTVNYWPTASDWVRGYLALPPNLVAVFVFWGFFFILLIGMHIILKRITQVIKWEQVHWAVQGIGLVLGGFRGLWWAGFLALALSSSGFGALQESVAERSILGPRLLDVSRAGLEQVAARFPGPKAGDVLIPPILSSRPGRASHGELAQRVL